MAYLTQQELEQLNFKSLGKNVKISDCAKIYNAEQIEIGDNSRIDDFCVLSGKIKIGRNVHIALHCNVAGGRQGVELDDFSGLAYYVNVFTQSDDYLGETLTNPTIPCQYKNETFGNVKIGKHSIIGSNSVIMPNAHIAEGCAIGIMSLVTKPTLAWSVYLGIPARRIKERKRDLLELEKLYLSEHG